MANVGFIGLASWARRWRTTWSTAATSCSCTVRASASVSRARSAG